MFTKRSQNFARKTCPWLLAVLCLGLPRSAYGEDGAEVGAQSDVQVAEQRAAQAFEAYQAKEYATSVALYLEAFKAAPSADLLYNIARIYDAKLGDRQLAITFYRRYIADPGAVAERIKRANDRLVELREAEIAASDRSPRESRPAPSPRDATGRSSGLATAGLVIGTAGLVGIGVGAGFGFAAMSQANTAKESCNGNSCTSQAGVDAAHDASTKATISTIGFAAGGTLLAAGAVLFFWGGSRKPAEREARAQVGWGATATPSQVAVEIHGAW